MSRQPQEQIKWRHRYNLLLPVQLKDWELEAFCFLNNRMPEKGGLGPYRHFRNMARLLWPHVQWNPWMDRQIWSLCQRDYAHINGEQIIRNVSWVGAAAAGKTHSSGLFALGWYLADPANSTVVLTTTEKGAIRMRVWPVLTKLNSEARDPDSGRTRKIFNVLNDKLIIAQDKKDVLHAISATAVKGGETQRAVEFIKGRHARRMLLIVDEATGTPEAIFQVINNWAKACKDLTVLSIANAGSRLDPHGRICEPAKGWESISVEDEMWPTKGVPDFDLPPGLCVHFDGFKSPNVIARKDQYPYLYTYSDYQKATQTANPNSLLFWANVRGFWTPQGTGNAVISAMDVDRFGGYESATFYGKATTLAALDPAFGGDECVLRFAKLGATEEGKQVLLLTEKLTIDGDTRSGDPLDLQIARQTRAACEARGVMPQYFAVDSTGTGRGVASHLQHEWSHKINKIEFGGAPSKKPASEEDPRPADEVYDRRVTELWYSIKELLVAGRLKGLDRETVIELSSREIELRGRKIKLDTKAEVKEKISRSPDNADAVALLVELARRTEAMGGRSGSSDWMEVVKQQNSVYNGLLLSE